MKIRNLLCDGVTREEADAYAARSHQRAAAAWEAGRFTEELVPVSVPQRKGEPVWVSRDEGVARTRPKRRHSDVAATLAVILDRPDRDAPPCGGTVE